MFDTKKHIYIMTTSLPYTYGGRTSALLQRGRLLTEKIRNINKATLVTTNYNPDYEYIYEDYREKKTVNKKMNFLNMYNDLRWNDNHEIKNNYQLYLEKELGQSYYAIPKKGKEHITVYYKNGVPILHTSFNTKTNRMGHVEIYANQGDKFKKRLYIDKNGNFHRIRYFNDNLKENIVRDVFIDRGYNPYVTKEFVYKNGELKVDRFILFKEDQTSEVFSNEKDLMRYWFDQFLKDGDTVINDVRHLDRPLLNVTSNIKRVFQLHGPHLSEPNNLSSVTKKSFRYLFEYISNDQDIIVSLTNGQKENILDKHPHLSNKIKVVPHCISGKPIIKEKLVDPNKICIVSRLVKLKRIDQAIKAFNDLLKLKPNCILEIYGQGEEEDNLRKLVNDLGIENSVKFRGFTNDPSKVFSTSAMFLMTSKLEGFGLTVLESVFNGCPVISYDITWGPSDIINSNNGILVGNGDIEGLTEAMLALLENPKKRKKVGEIDTKFTQGYFLKEWEKMLL